MTNKRDMDRLTLLDLLTTEKTPAVDGGLCRFAVTNDREALGEQDAHLAQNFEKAWRIVGNLIFAHRLIVNFADAEWARDLMWTVEQVTEDLEVMDK